MIFYRKLPIPMDIKEQFPVTQEILKQRELRIKELEAIFSGKDDRLILIIGPCSADNEDSVLDYIYRLRGVEEKVKDKIMIVPRIYTNKPRTTGEGYKGMLHQPDPNASPDLLKGLIAIRKMHIRRHSSSGDQSAQLRQSPERDRTRLDLTQSYIHQNQRKPGSEVPYSRYARHPGFACWSSLPRYITPVNPKGIVS